MAKLSYTFSCYFTIASPSDRKSLRRPACCQLPVKTVEKLRITVKGRFYVTDVSSRKINISLLSH